MPAMSVNALACHMMAPVTQSPVRSATYGLPPRSRPASVGPPPGNDPPAMPSFVDPQVSEDLLQVQLKVRLGFAGYTIGFP